MASFNEFGRKKRTDSADRGMGRIVLEMLYSSCWLNVGGKHRYSINNFRLVTLVYDVSICDI